MPRGEVNRAAGSSHVSAQRTVLDASGHQEPLRQGRGEAFAFGTEWTFDGSTANASPLRVPRYHRSRVWAKPGTVHQVSLNGGRTHATPGGMHPGFWSGLRGRGAGEAVPRSLRDLASIPARACTTRDLAL